MTLPLQIGLGFMIFSLTSGLILRFWLQSFIDTLRTMGFG